MEYIHDTRDFRFTDTAVTIGKFDGLHAGHRALIERLLQCRDEGLKTVVISLDFRPDAIAGRDNAAPLCSEEERIRILEEMGVDVFISYPFTKEDAQQEPVDFINSMLIDRLGARTIVVGNDFRFGRDRKGDAWFLQTYGSRHGYKTITMRRIEYEDEPISSTRIRNALAAGDKSAAETMLGKKKGCLRFIALLLAMLAGPVNAVYTTPVETVCAASAKINYSKKTLYVGRTVKLKIKNSKLDFIWTSSNEKVAKVAENGTVTAVKKGSAIITATNGKKTFTCTVTIKNPYVTPKAVQVLIPGDTLQLGVKGATAVKYTSSAPAVASVDAKTGLVTALKGSEYFVTIKVKCDNGKTYKRDVCVVSLDFDFEDETGETVTTGTDTDSGTSETGSEGKYTGTDGDSGSPAVYLSVPTIADDSWGLFNPQKKTSVSKVTLYQVSNEAEYAAAFKEAMDNCIGEFAIRNLTGTASQLNAMFVDMCGRYSIGANQAGYKYIAGDTDTLNPNSIEDLTWFDYQYEGSESYNELFEAALTQYFATGDGTDIFTNTVEVYRPIYSAAARASAALKYTDYAADSEAQRVLAAATDLVKEAVATSEDLVGVIRSINDRICELTTYDAELAKDSSTVALGTDGCYHVPSGRDATGILDNGAGVCQAYASLFSLCMDILGVPNEYVCNEAATHVWNRIYVDGSWYHVDVTWNDTSNGNVYFMVKDEDLTALDSVYSKKNLQQHAFADTYLTR